MEKLPALEVSMKVRPAKPEDLKVDDRTLNYGQVFWLRSMVTGQWQNQPMKITKDTDPNELAEWLQHNMIYVPVKWSESIEIPVADV